MEKVKVLAAEPAPAKPHVLLPGPWSTPAWTMEERLHRIEMMGQKISGYIRFMGEVAKLDGASQEAKERAVTEFYERLIVVEKQLARIHESFRLQ